MAITVGIDLGTTNSSLAYIDEFGKAVTALNPSGKSVTPSVIGFKGGEYLFGEEAKELQGLGVDPVAAFFKRQMGDELFVFPADGMDYSAIELSSLLLKKMKEDAESHLNEIIHSAVITVPAYFRDPERKATIEAGRRAGLNVLQVINEPTAAAVAYGINQQSESQTILVYDLGGGTFDVTLLQIEKNTIRVLSSDGDHQLGGKDWDDRIIEYLSAKFKDEFGMDPLEDAESFGDLLVQAEQAKKRLTSVERTVLAITHDGERGRYELDRDTFEQITSDLIERTKSLTERVLDEMNLKPEKLGGVLLVGGSTRMPMVQSFIREQLGKEPRKGINADEAVALGAALVAEQRLAKDSAISLASRKGGQVQTFDVTNHSLGMIAVNHDKTEYINSIILPKNAQIPCRESRPYQYRTRSVDNRLEIYLVQGESESPKDVAYLECYVVHDIPHQSSGTTVLDIEYHYDESGTVSVTVQERSGRQQLKVTAEKLPDDVPLRFLQTPELEVEALEHITAYLVFDLSGSMSGTPLKKAKKAALTFLQQSDLSHCSIGIMAVSDHVKTKLKASQNARKIENAINDLECGETGYGNDAHPFDEIMSRFGRVKGRRFAIVLADGVWSYQKRAVKFAKKCHAAEIDIIAIGFGGADRKFLSDIASSDEDVFFTSLNRLVETFSTIAQVVTESRGIIGSR